MQFAASLEPEERFRDSFELNRQLPERLSALKDIAENFYWSWQPEGTNLFHSLEPALWDKCEQNPITFLRRISGLRLWQAAADDDYTARIAAFKKLQDAYLAEPAQASGIVRPGSPAAYFCAEYGVHNSLPVYSGGLGILAGDHLKSASDLNVPMVAVGLLYRFGYFRQRVGHDGWQEEEYQDLFASDLAVSPVLDNNGSRIYLNVHIRGREVKIQAWLAKIGRISLYLLDTNLRDNADVDRLITGHLYGGNSETRIVQEKVLGIGGVRLLRSLGIEPSVYHLNEGHSAFLTLELVREFLADQSDSGFADALTEVRRKCVFTTHTPVAAGNDVFAPKDLRDCFDANFIAGLKLTEDEFYALGRVDPSDPDELFGMTPLSLKMCRSANGVSKKHGEVSRGLWADMYSNAKSEDDVPISHVTNGVHAPTWVAPSFQRLYQEKFGIDWAKMVSDADEWAKAVKTLSEQEIWSSHAMLKQILIAYLRQRTKAKDIGGQETIHEHLDTNKLFSSDILTIGFARRVAAYKRWNLLLTDLDRLLRLVDDLERPVQFVFAGKAHPQDRTAKKILQGLMSINHDSNWQNRAVFVEDYDQEVARYLVHGVDVWMNVPRRPHEASGTSGMKAAMNGGLNFSILDGWWIEGFNEKNGFAIGGLSAEEDDATMDALDAESLYSVLENEIIPTFYDRGADGLPSRWIEMMRNALATLTPGFSSDRMVRDYISEIYNEE